MKPHRRNEKCALRNKIHRAQGKNDCLYYRLFGTDCKEKISIINEILCRF